MLIPFIQRGSTLIAHLSSQTHSSDKQFFSWWIKAHHWFHKPFSLSQKRIQDIQRGGKTTWQIMLYI